MTMYQIPENWDEMTEDEQEEWISESLIGAVSSEQARVLRKAIE